MNDFRLPFEVEEKIEESEEISSKCLLSTIVLNKWQVTTCYRQSSAWTETPNWYYETYVWELKDGGRELIRDATESGHVNAVQFILDHGGWNDEEYMK